MWTLKTFLGEQKGAMFGMDARIALVIASVLAGAGGVTMMSKLERSRIQAAERGAIDIASGVKTHYATVEPFDEMPNNLDDVFEAGFVSGNAKNEDPWGKKWHYNHINDYITLSGVDIKVQYVVIHSSGKDGIDDSVNVSSVGDWQDWEPRNDDKGTKFNTLDIEKQRLALRNDRLRAIVGKLDGYNSARFIDGQRKCEVANPPAECTRDGKNYTLFNYYPRELGDQTSALYYDDVSGYPLSSPYSSGSVASMQDMLNELKLPDSFAIGTWGGILQYDSNVYKRSDPPFEAAIWYE